MINSLLKEAREKLKPLDSVDEIEKLLFESIEVIERVSKTESISTFKYPLAALLIEFYMKSPELIYQLSLKNKTVSEIFEVVFVESKKEIATL